MDYLLFAFGDYTKTDPHINLIVDFVSQISSKEVTYQYGDSGIIVSFSTVKTVDEITDYLEINLTKLTAMFFRIMDTKPLDELFNILFKPVEVKKVLTLDEILDKIIDKGINNLTQTEKEQLDEYSKK